MRSCRRPLTVAASLVALTLVGGCNSAELERLNQELDRSQAALQATKAEAAQRAAESQERQTELTAALTASQQQLTTSNAELDETADELEKQEAKHRRLESHRDELTEWVETVLLPIAEEHEPDLAQLKVDALAMTKEVERIRGLEFKRPFMRRLVKREDVGKSMKRDLERDLPRDEAEKMIHVMAEFGVVGPDTDLYEIFSEFLEAGAAAYYKPDTQTFYLIEGNEGPGARPIIFHELIHTVEDQHYDLRKMNEEREDDGDGAMALKGLVEGSADLWQTDYQREHPEEFKAMMQAQMKPELMQKQMRMMQRVPTFLVAMMGLYPYKNGSAFLRGIGVKTPADIAKVWADPPASTEQVLHPEKFSLDGTGRDYPQHVADFAIDRVLGDGWEEIDNSNMGELMTGLVMAHLRLPGQANSMARLMSIMDLATQGVRFKAPLADAVNGWDGDRYVACHRGETNDVCVVWTSVWDSEQDAVEFATEYGRLMGKQLTDQMGERTDAPVRYQTDTETAGIDRTGNKVVIVLGAPADKADALFAVGMAAEVTPDERDPNDSPK